METRCCPCQIKWLKTVFTQRVDAQSIQRPDSACNLHNSVTGRDLYVACFKGLQLTTVWMKTKAAKLAFSSVSGLDATIPYRFDT